MISVPDCLCIVGAAISVPMFIVMVVGSGAQISIRPVQGCGSGYLGPIRIQIVKKIYERSDPVCNASKLYLFFQYLVSYLWIFR